MSRLRRWVLAARSAGMDRVVAWLWKVSPPEGGELLWLRSPGAAKAWVVAASWRRLGPFLLWAVGHSTCRSARGNFRCGADRAVAASTNFAGCDWHPPHPALASPTTSRRLPPRQFSWQLRPAWWPVRC